MGLREWLMILGGVILLLIVADGIRRMRKIKPGQDEQMDAEERARQEQLRRELPSGGARIVQTHDVEVFDDDPIPVLRHEVAVPDGVYSGGEASSRFADYDPNPALTRAFASEPEPADEPQAAFAPSAQPEDDYSETSYPETNNHELHDQAEFNAADERVAQSDDDSLIEDSAAAEHAATEEYAEATAAEDALSVNQQDEHAEPGYDDIAFEAISDTVTLEASGDAVVTDDADAQDFPESQTDSVELNSSELHITEFDAIPEDDLDDLEPLEPLAERFAAEKARHLAEQKAAAARLKEQAQQEAVEPEPEDPVKAAARRIQGKHTGPRPSERMKQQVVTEDDISLAEKQYREQQQAAEKARAEQLKVEQLNAEQAQLEAQAAAAQRQNQQREEQRRQAEQATAPKLRERPVSRKPLLTADEEREQIAGSNELLVMHVKCKDERGFHGAALLHVVMQCGMQFGDMKVFHRFVKTEDGPQIQFSMMSSVNPGVFDIDHIDDLYIPSVSFVMGLPAPGSSQECFTMMLETAKVIVRHLNGELRDEDRSVMTPQTIEHYKQRIQEFERRKQLARMR